MKTVLTLVSLFSVLVVSQGQASSLAKGTIESCATDIYISELMQEQIKPDARLDVYNAKGEIVGAFDRDPETQELNNLYLCGRNSGHYYAEGNFSKSLDLKVYNDEYISTTISKKIPGGIKIAIKIAWVGEDEEYADYGVVKDVIFVKN